MTWQGTLPEGLVNNDTILDRNAARIDQVRAIGRDLVVTIQCYEGHGYRLQKAVDGNLFGPWTDISGCALGTNGPITFLVTMRCWERENSIGRRSPRRWNFILCPILLADIKLLSHRFSC